MTLKLITLAALFASVSPIAHISTDAVQIAADGGDLNPQPLPPIAEDKFGLYS